jgi:antitoxin StbD
MLDALDDQDLCRLVNERRNEELIDVVFDQFT